MSSGVLQRILEYAGLDQAVIFTLLTKMSQAVAGVVSLLLIAKFFAPETMPYRVGQPSPA